MEGENNTREVSNTIDLQNEVSREGINQSTQSRESEPQGVHRQSVHNASQRTGDGDKNEPKLIEDRVINLIEGSSTSISRDEVLSSITYSKNGEIKLKENLPSIEKLQPYLEYKTGGVKKEGRGVLDEYFTDESIVKNIGLILKEIYDKDSPIQVLEPSVGDGRFLTLGKEFLNAKFTGYEINPITAQITKIKNPQSSIFNTSFETFFIEENGKKKEENLFKRRYDLVVGNPPYGLHRGFYKGLGEEPRIARYEDYFVKRSLDVLKEGGIVAMVLPSGWLNRTTKLKQANLVDAYRLPQGAFKGTQIGTDIIILQKQEKAKEKSIKGFFEDNPEKVLGTLEMTTNRFGREEQVVRGQMGKALISLRKEIEANKENYPTYTYLETPEQVTEQVTEQVAEQKETELQQYKEVDPSKINSKHLKYILHKEDEVISSSNVLLNDVSKPEELEALKDTFYDGSISNYDKHKEYANYHNGKYYHDFYYTEGNIIEKLEQLEIDYNSNNIETAQYEKQKNLLLKNLPKAQTLEEILLSPNHEFIHNFVIEEKEKEEYDYELRRNTSKVVKHTLADEFKDFIGTLEQKAFAGSNPWEVRAYVDNENVTGSDKERNALVRERRKEAGNNLFTKFLNQELSSEIKERYVDEFNKTYNSVNIPDYSKFPLFSKINKNFNGTPLVLTDVQQAGIGQLTTKGVGILAHEVGFGKTLSGIISMHEAMHRGNASRPLIIVPNENILKQWVDTIYQVIPNAKVNVLGNLGVKYDLSNFQVNDGDISLVTYSGFNNIGFSEEVVQELSEKFSYISEHETRSIKLTAREEELEATKIEELQGILKKGRVYSWEDFGFDHMTFDEVHNANHIVSKVRIEDRRFSSDFRSQQQSTSLLGINTWMASQYLQQTNDGRNVTLLSATPFTNKPLEYYSILSLVANDRLESLGFFNVNTFFETFMEADNEMEIDALGEVKFKLSVNRFKNNNLFQKLLREYIDIKGTEDNPELTRPNRINKEFEIPQNELTEKQYDILNASFNSEDDGAILTHILNSRKIAISPYLSPYYNEAAPSNKEFIENSPKIHTTLELLKQNIKDNPQAGQIIYSELGIEVFPKIKEYLVNEGILKENEIHIITGKTTKPRRIKYQNEFNSGKAKLILGSSAIQEGMNLQTNTTDMYLLSLPYNFTQLRQIEGRAWRQGNVFSNVRVNYILTNNSIDVFMLQKLQSKQNRYEAAMRNSENILDVSDISTSELKTALITDPNIRAEMEVKILEERLNKEKQQQEAEQAFVLRKFEKYNQINNKLEAKEEDLEQKIELAKTDKWWETRIPLIKQELVGLKEQIQEEITKLEKQGVNVNKIEEQNQYTKEKIEEINQKKEDLVDYKSELIEKYIEEKKAREAKFSLPTILEERQKENKVLFEKRNLDQEEKKKKIQDVDATQNLEPKKEVKKEEDQIRSNQNKEDLEKFKTKEAPEIKDDKKINQGENLSLFPPEVMQDAINKEKETMKQENKESSNKSELLEKEKIQKDSKEENEEEKEKEVLDAIVKSKNPIDTLQNRSNGNLDTIIETVGKLGLGEEYHRTYKNTLAVANFVEFVAQYSISTPKNKIDADWERANEKARKSQEEFKEAAKNHPQYQSSPEHEKEEGKGKEKESPKPLQEQNPVPRQKQPQKTRNMTFQEYRSEIPIIEAAASIGYEIDKGKGKGKFVEMVHPATQDRIVINNPNNPSQQLYFNRNGGSDKGNLIEFVKQRINDFNPNTKSSNIYAQINSVLGEMAGKPVNIRNTNITNHLPSYTFDKESYNLRDLNTSSHRDVTYLQKRGLDNHTIKEFAPDIQVSQNKHFNNIAFPLKNTENEIVGIDIRNFNFKGLAKGGEKEFWSHQKGKEVRNIVLGESPIDLMSYHQLANNNGKALNNTLFISTGGAFSEEKIKGLLKQFPIGEHNYVLGFDNDFQGKLYDIKFYAAASDTKIDMQRNNGEYQFTTEKSSFKLDKENVSLNKFLEKNGSKRVKGMKLHKPRGSVDFNEVLMKTRSNDVEIGLEI